VTICHTLKIEIVTNRNALRKDDRMDNTPTQPKRVSPFEAIRHEDEDGEYWSARELAKELGYAKWANFEEVISKAKTACDQSGQEIDNHFADVGKVIIPGGRWGHQSVDDVHLSRYACYLVVQNGDPSKRLVALGQAYFAVQTRRAEVLAELSEMSEAQQRIILRDQLATEHGLITELITEAGVVTQSDFKEYFDHKYEGLYDKDYRQLQKHRGLKPGETPLNYMGPEESVLNLMQDQQVRAKTERDRPQTKEQAGKIAFEVGRVFRRALEEIGAPMPEDLPKAENIDIVRREEAKRLKAEARQHKIEEEDRLGLWAQLTEEKENKEDSN
jgi:DNA-damage-inducible protein D